MTSAGRGLVNTLDRMKNALKNPESSEEAIEYFMRPRQLVYDRIALIDNALRAPLQYGERSVQEHSPYERMIAELRRKWDMLREDQQWYEMHRIVDAGCLDVAQFLLRHLQAEEPFHRSEVLSGVAHLKCREYRCLCINVHLNDPYSDVRKTALTELGTDLFKGERDREILKLAFAAFDNPQSSVGMRLTAGAVMAFQFGMETEPSAPGWWNEEEEDLQDPWIQRAVAETRRLLEQKINGGSTDNSG